MSPHTNFTPPTILLTSSDHIQHFPMCILCSTSAKSTFLFQYVCQNHAILLNPTPIPFFSRKHAQFYHLAFIPLSLLYFHFTLFMPFLSPSWWPGATSYSAISKVLCNTWYSEKNCWTTSYSSLEEKAKDPSLKYLSLMGTESNRSILPILWFYKVLSIESFSKYALGWGLLGGSVN